MKRIARISAIAYLIIFISGFYANFNVLERLVDHKNPIGSVANLVNNHTQFANGLIGFTIMLVFDVVLVWSLFGLTKYVNKTLSIIASFFRFLHAFFFSMALFKLTEVYLLISRDQYVVDIHQKILLLLTYYDLFWTIGLLFFSVHLFYLGYLSLKSTSIANGIGYALMVAAIGYFVESMAKSTLANYSDYRVYFETLVVCTGVVGELSFTIWLLFKGFRKRPFPI
ncbi:DUF4386 domain-containing protein [Maribacter polysiphoniae]|uniref:DUF4386 domain-containing protein n=1 Tax=Maribacter polysiphoniae TaxID=429344 RepID=UPI0023540149|nr:DUF4386 domain-containing protein [Maribacter polysiphoniae]